MERAGGPCSWPGASVPPDSWERPQLRVIGNGSTRFRTASIVKVDILAALLLQHQRSGTPLTNSEQDLARSMITSSDNAAASSLWRRIDAAVGLSAANRLPIQQLRGPTSRFEQPGATRRECACNERPPVRFRMTEAWEC